MKRVALSPAGLRAAEIVFWALLAGSWFLLPDRHLLMSQVFIVGLFAVSLDMALGHAGILTVGHAAFFGAGAYAAGLLARHGWGEPFSGLALALAVGLALGWASSFLVVRGADLTRLMVTIGICMLMSEAVNRLSSITGGSDGLQGMQMSPLLGRFAFDLYGDTAFCYSLAVVLAVFLGVRRVLGSPFGLALRGIHDQPVRMRAIGAPVHRRLRLAYAMSAGVAAIAGGLLAQTTQFVGMDTIGFERSAEVLVILVLGGSGRLYGGLVGAVVYLLLQDHFADMDPRYWMLWLGLFLIAAALLGRGGILGMLARLTRPAPAKSSIHPTHPEPDPP